MEGDNSDGGQQPAPVPQLIQISIQDKNNTMMTIVDEFSITETTKNEFHLTWKKDKPGHIWLRAILKLSLRELVNYNDI